MQGGLREGSVRSLGGEDEGVDDLRRRLGSSAGGHTRAQGEAHRDKRFLANDWVLLWTCVPEDGGQGLRLFEVPQDLERRSDRARRALRLALLREKPLRFGEVAPALTAVGGLDALAHRDRGSLGRLSVRRGKPRDERVESLLATELGEDGVERSALFRTRLSHARSDARNDLHPDARHGARSSTPHLRVADGEEGKDRVNGLFGANPRKGVERMALQERYSARQRTSQCGLRGRRFRAQLAENDRRGDLFLDGRVLEQRDDAIDVRHVRAASRLVA